MSEVLSPKLLRATPVKPHRLIFSGVSGPQAVAATEELGDVKHAEDIILCLDFHAPDVEAKMPRARTRCRAFADRMQVPHVFDLNAGVGSKVVLEWGLVPPGTVVAGSGRCLGLVGGVGALGLRLEPAALARTAHQGFLDVTIPDSLHLVSVEGVLPRHLSAWDVVQGLKQSLGPGIEGSIVEIGGGTESWSLDFRQSLSGLLSESGAFSALVHPDQVLIKEMQEWGMAVDSLPTLEPDAGAAPHTLDCSNLEPVVQMGPSLVPLPADETQVDGVFIGSCYGGHLADLEIAAEVLRKGGGVDPSVRLVISPASMEVARAALHAGYLELFLEAGAMITVPGAGVGLSSGGTVLGEGEHLVSTAFYPPHPGGEPEHTPTVSRTGPAAAAAAAVRGKLSDPRLFLD